MTDPTLRPVFCLVHGGAHGAWCWERLTPLLSSRGYDAVAVDLPCDDDSAGAREYAEVVVAALADEDRPVVVVGHSLGGLTAPLVAQLRPVEHLLFLAALLPVVGSSLNEQRARHPEMMFPYSGGVAGLRDRFFNACRPDDADWAMARLRTQSLTPFVETTPLEQWPSTPRSYVVCDQDRACNPAWARRAVPGRIGVVPVELAGADHSPFLSMPDRLADLMVEAVRPGDGAAARRRGRPPTHSPAGSSS